MPPILAGRTPILAVKSDHEARTQILAQAEARRFRPGSVAPGLRAEYPACVRSVLDGFDQAELRQRGDAIVETDLLDDLAVDHWSTVVPVKCIFRPVAAGRPPTRKSLKAGPVCVPPPSHWPTT